MQTFLAKSERESRFLSYGASQYVRSSSVIFTFFSCNPFTSLFIVKCIVHYFIFSNSKSHLERTNTICCFTILLQLVYSYLTPI